MHEPNAREAHHEHKRTDLQNITSGIARNQLKTCVIVTRSTKSYKETKAEWNAQLVLKLIGCVFHEDMQIACDEKLTKSWQNDRVSFP